ncbi:putative disease resistance protein [Senna tora]|uniref:Putative disease resistance protein n=1 Tax=Senna tora TaxID=362788 RepID=A0A834WVP7_9FABA|nr:putative disease resistance protein [Senna tora]
MAEIVISIAAKLAEYLVQPTISQGRYLICGAKITRNLELEKERLVLTRESVLRLVEEALNRTEIVNKVVEKWLEEVGSVLAEVENLEQELRANNGCFRGWCPNWRRYSLFKEMAKKTDVMMKLNTNRDFNPFSFRARLPDIEYFSSGNFMYFKSTKLAADELLKALGDDSIHMIGLYGMGGSGKTTLAKEVGKKAKEAKLFDRVIFTTVSQTPIIKRIQQEIADLLGLRFSFRVSEVERARKIAFRLQGGERILVILDDVWGKLNLEEIGIAFGELTYKFKIILTTRRLQLCALMDCQKQIPLNLLYEDEALTLLQKHVGLNDKYFTLLNGLAEEIARECKGLHIAIEAVGASLKGKSVDEWKVALDKLKHSKPIDVEDGVKDAFTCLKLSYDYLRNKEAKLLFLMCSMFPEDHDISVEDLFRYGIGLGLCGEVDSFELARSQVNVGINNLLSSCLLMRSEKKDHLKMHDVTRDVALWIARKEDLPIHVILGKNLSMLAEDGAFKDCYAVSSYYQEIDKLPCQLDWPKLEILILNTSWSLRSSRASFEGIKGLKVMAITAVNYFKAAFLSLPRSTWLLNNLRTLRLVEWHLDDISSVVNLASLEILDLRGCHVTLPNGIEKLKKLRLLDLSLSRIGNSFEVIRRCSQLQELYLFRASPIVTSECFHPDTKLQRYALEIGRCNQKIPRHLVSKRSLYLGEPSISTSDMFIKDLLRRAEDVYLGFHQGCCKNIIPELVQTVGGMNELTKLRLYACSEIECLIDTSSYSFQVDVVYPKLVNLVLENMENLSELICGPSLVYFFENLEEVHLTHCFQLRSIFPKECNLCSLNVLKLEHCPTLITSLFPMSVAQTMVLLQELTVKNCCELKCLLTTEGEEITPDNSGFLFPKLRILSVASCQNLEFIFPISCVQGLKQLQEISIVDASKLKYAFGQHGHESHLAYQTEILLPFLGILRLEGLSNLLSIFPENYPSRWPSLTELHWVNCPMLAFPGMNVMADSELRQLHLNKGQGAAAFETSRNQLSNEALLPTVLEVKEVEIQNCAVVNIFHLERVEQVMASKLESLRLTNLPELRSIWMGCSSTQILTLQYLQHLEVYDCGKLKSVFSSIIYTFSIPMLTTLIISNCEELEEIIAENEEPHSLGNAQICFPKLRELQVLRCNKLKRLFSTAVARMLPHLKFLIIAEAAELLVVFKHKNGDCTNSKVKIELPNLRKIQLLKLPNLIEFCQEEILLPTLKMIELIALPSLTEFCQGFKLPSVKLHKMIIEECPKLNSISGRSPVISLPQITQEQQENGTSGSQLCNEVSALLPNDLNVNNLVIEDCLAMNLFYPEGVESVASELVSLQLKNFPEMRLIWMDCTHFVSLYGLQELSVYNCGKLKSVFSANIHRSLPQLMRLSIFNCEELEEIIAENDDTQNLLNGQVCFPKLESLKVEGCHKLKSLFSATMVRMIPQLNSLHISNCGQLQEIFGFGNTEDNNINNKKEIVLPHLRQVSLGKLSNLIDICQGCTLHAITDGEVSHEILALQAVLNVKMQLGVNEEQGPIMVSNLESLSLELPELEFIWKGPTLISFQFLTSLFVIRCRKLRCIFSGAIIRSLPQLESLNIRDCEELEEIISEEEAHFPNPSTSYSQEPSFPKLRHLDVGGCNKLRYVLPLYILGDLPRLEDFWLSSCSQLEQVFGCVPENHDAHRKEGPTVISFARVEGCRKLRCIFSAAVIRSLPQLECLYIEDCEELEEIISSSSSSSEAHFPNLRRLKIEGCNGMKCVFPVSILGDIPCLKNLKIRRCSQLEQLFGCVPENHDAEMMEIEFPNLTELRLEELPDLVDICQGFTFHAVKLSEVRIDECPKFAPFSRPNQEISVDQSKKVVRDGRMAHEMQALQAFLNVKEEGAIMVSNLNRLELKNIGEMEFIWKGPTLISFQRLERLRVEGCRRLRCIFSSAFIRSLPRLYELYIINCEELEEIISLPEEEANFPNASSTSHPQHPYFPMLSHLYVEGCNSLRCVFPLSNSLYLPCLRGLFIRRCSELDQVLGCAPQNLPNLLFVTLEQLPNLTNFCRGFESQLKLDALKECEVKDCPKFSSTTIPALHKFITPTQIQDTDENQKEEKENNIDYNVGGETFDNINDSNDEDEDEDKDVNEDNKNNNVEDGEEDDKDEDIDLVGFLDNDNA